MVHTEHSVLYSTDRSQLPAPAELLGDLDRVYEEPPNYNDSARKPYLREVSAYETLMYHFLKEVMMDGEFKRKSVSEKMSSWVDTSLEAYLVVAYVNGYDKWLDECKKAIVDPPDEVNTDTSGLTQDTILSVSVVRTRFTSNGRGSGKNSGWSQVGIGLYNAVWDALQMQRDDSSKTVLRAFESCLLGKFVSAKRGPNTSVSGGPVRKRARNGLAALMVNCGDNNATDDATAVTPVTAGAVVGAGYRRRQATSLLMEQLVGANVTGV